MKHLQDVGISPGKAAAFLYVIKKNVWLRSPQHLDPDKSENGNAKICKSGPLEIKNQYKKPKRYSDSGSSTFRIKTR